MFKKTLFALLLLLVISYNASAQYKWALKSNKDGIKIYTSEIVNSKLKALRIECNYETTLTQMVATLLDLKTRPEWIYHTKSIRLVKQVSPSELFYYSEISLPWPAQNRDFVAHLITTQDEETKIVTLDGPVAPTMVPERDGIVRVKNSISKWLIVPVNKNEVKVEYTIQLDPGGAIPAWLSNMFASEGPTESFKALRSQLKKPGYKTAHVPFIKNY
ncbi:MULTISPECIES: START domain-containing protein [unclassified Mucilaginibacter]|uniref:START domain-containing protein n=1 Tax=unclassified Mucilaginibacter TaxID=2617802 RepID=UPI002AC9C847|nr:MULTISPECIES: START domain-containing protein [unclassified Mucilaginibacter]MEB0260995.1 START domain-containing protein [Mucilaginibacter sp. 10I4]MEB0279590.1 START domain-containing protein [Mucilaginibacter sp. 10B2]MEB0300347.1 START domain-containing protein [Mucilaginibacter sp. 5C4]WPX22542.1 START domain-containing protein [Mucilaginibacter sp. 5C4]